MKNPATLSSFRFGKSPVLIAVLALCAASLAAAPFERIKVHYMGGSIDIKDAADGADLQTMGGDITVASARNKLDMQTMGGNIQVGAAESVKAETMGGNIEIRSASGAVRAETMGGNVKAHIRNPLAQGGHDITLSSMGGNVELIVPKDFPMTIEVSLTYTKKNEGRYKIIDNLGLTQTTSKDWDSWHGDPRKTIKATGHAGDGSNKVIVKTVNGDITVKSE